MTPRFRTRLTLLAAVPLLAACGIGTKADTETSSGSTSGSDARASAVPAIVELVPDRIMRAGKLVVATDPTYAPIIYRDDAGMIVGTDASIAEAVAARMGVQVEWVNVPFDGIIAGLAARKFDASWAAFSITPERMEEVSFVSYMQAGTQILLRAESTADVSSSLGLCGLTVAAQRGTTQDLEVLPRLQKDCAAAGEPGIETLILLQQDNVNQAVAVGRADAEIADSGLVAYQAAQKPDIFRTVDLVIDPALIGTAVQKGDTALTKAIQAATQAIIDDGTYARILGDAELEAGAITTSQVNPTGNGS